MDVQTVYAGIATEAETDDLVQLINSAYRGDSSRIGWTTEADILDGIRIDAAGVRAIIADPGADLHTFYAEGMGLIACVYLKEEEKNLYLGMLSVRPTLQAGGIGKYILNYAEIRAKGLGKNSVRMTVIHIRTELIAWYNRHGYVPTGETEPWIDGEHFGDRKADFHFIVLKKDLL